MKPRPLSKSLHTGVCNRRRFLVASAASLAGLNIVPAAVLGRNGHTAPNSRITMAFIGTGSQGLRVMLQFLRMPEVQAVAVCDAVESASNYHQWAPNEFADAVHKLLETGTGWQWLSPNEPLLELTPTLRVPAGVCGREPARRIVDAWNAKRQGLVSSRSCASFADFRELLAAVKDLDAVVVGTPDHLHAVVSVAAMRAGRHVFCQKPMARTLHEARRMAEAARETGVVTQVAVGPQASEDTRRLQEWVVAGAIGRVREVLNWSTRPLWPQGIPVPRDAPPIPRELNWDLWLGPAAWRPYHPAYLPFVWRGWVDFGCGALGDMGCYSLDTVYRVLELSGPLRAEASSTHRYEASYPQASLVTLHLAARGNGSPVTFHWFDGGLRPWRRPELDPGQAWEAEGLLFVGEEGSILCDFVGGRPRLLPASRRQSFREPPRTLPRSPGNEREWIEAILDRRKRTGANFEFSARVTEALCLGNLAVLTGEPLEWDSATLQLRGSARARAWVAPPAREGWAI